MIDRRGDPGDRLRREQQERHDELGNVVGGDLDAVEGHGKVVEPPAQRPRHRLRLVVVFEASQVTPARITAHLDHPGAELDPEHQPAQEDQDQSRRRAAVRSEEDRQESGLEQQRLPPERVPRLADVDDRQVQRPEHRPGQHRHDGRRSVDDPGDGQKRNADTGPRHAGEEAIGVVDVEQARCLAEPHGAHEVRDREDSPRTEQRSELVEGDEEGDQVEDAHRSQEHEPADPVPRSRPQIVRADLRSGPMGVCGTVPS